jgi:di/tricarboxylate transporter
MNPPPSWIQWFAVSIPICILLDLAIWALLLLVYNPKPGPVANVPEIFSHSQLAKFNGTQMFVIFVSISTIILWCAESSLEGVVGDMGVIAILPIIAFFGTGILTKDDWNSMLWSGTFS